VAERFAGCLRDDDMVARMFGDVFAGVCEDIDDDSTVTPIVRRLRKALARPFEVDGDHVELAVSIGTAMALPHDRPEQAIRRAENARTPMSPKGPIERP
jgi:GGDEF domain-containing protein